MSLCYSWESQLLSQGHTRTDRGGLHRGDTAAPSARGKRMSCDLTNPRPYGVPAGGSVPIVRLRYVCANDVGCVCVCVCVCVNASTYALHVRVGTLFTTCMCFLA